MENWLKQIKEQENAEQERIAREEQEAWAKHDAEEEAAEAQIAEQAEREIEDFYATVDDEEATDDEYTDDEPVEVSKQAANRRKKTARYKKRCKAKADVADLSSASRLEADIKNGLITIELLKDAAGNVIHRVLAVPGSKTSRAKVLKKRGYPRRE